ncbi:CHAP domain-containing protein [Streptococcus caballi]|uniref:CHAP domain-containing protein n=1 Tax=Streptococcus caballi TaxID=439220 RepID=UPI00036A9F62|nr:CHAP domain-containing protein [Streptococcus caballi]
MKNKAITSAVILALIFSNSLPLTVFAETIDTNSSQAITETSVSTEESETRTESSDPVITESNVTENTASPAESSSTQETPPTTQSSSVAPSETTTSTSDEETSQSSSTVASSSTSPSSTVASSTATSSSTTTASSSGTDKSQSQTTLNPAASVSSATEQKASEVAVSQPQLNTNAVATTGSFDDSYVDLSKYIALNQAFYVEHWSGSDAYSHNLLAHRYGITAEQLDGYLASTGIAYDSKRINGAKLLEWEKESGLDVRAILAIAIAESSLGTAGVATAPGANMFGYGAFDSNPNNANQYNDEVAVRALTKETIIKNKNLSFQIQDQKAQKLANGMLNTFIDGGVYFTDASGTGKRRAETMKAIDKWIDEHGGTPAIPEELKQVNLAGVASVVNVPAGYSISRPVNSSTYLTASYPWGQCTWYVYNRAKEFNINFDAFMGNGGDWQFKAGYETSHKPEVGTALSFLPGQAGADGTYGHVAFVEEVKEDGSILISESNVLGLGTISYRTFSAAQAAQFTYVKGHQ